MNEAVVSVLLTEVDKLKDEVTRLAKENTQLREGVGCEKATSDEQAKILKMLWDENTVLLAVARAAMHWDEAAPDTDEASAAANELIDALAVWKARND